jgi:hypothetical protein
MCRKRLPIGAKLRCKWRELLAINLLSKCQVRLGVGGDLMEVGVFHGRTAILFGLLAQSGETFYGIDAFGTSTEIQHEDRQVDLDYYGDF